MSSATFNYNDANVLCTGTFSGSATQGGVPVTNSVQSASQWQFDFYGESLEIQAFCTTANPLRFQVDGGAQSTPAITANTMGYWTLASGLTLGWHTVTVWWRSQFSISQTASFRVTASDNNPQIRLTDGFAVYANLTAGYIGIDGRTQTFAYLGTTWNRRTALGYGHYRFRARTSAINAYVLSGGTTYVGLYVDGVWAGSGTWTNPATSSGTLDFINVVSVVGATLDGTANHDYEVVWSTNSNSVFGYLSGFAVSTSFDTSATWTARPLWGVLGDSIARGQGATTQFDSFAYVLARQNGATVSVVAVDGSQEASAGATNATALVATGTSFVYMFNEYGTNDMAAVGATPSAGFGTADVTVLNTLLAATGVVQVFRLGILPRAGSSNVNRPTWNGFGANAIRANIALSNAPSRVTYIDPDSVGLIDPTDYAEVAPTERLHPNSAGHAKIAATITAAIVGNQTVKASHYMCA